MSFAFGLALFGGALAVTLRAYLVAAADETQEIRARIALESAAATVLGELAAGGAVKPHAEVGIDGDRRTVRVTIPGTKVDPARDSPGAVAEAGRTAGLVVDPDFAATAGGLVEVSAHHRLNASREDCLRQVFTYGRGGAPLIDRSAPPEDLMVRAGDQVDLRIQASSGPVLWVRARFTGAETGWRLHDYRLLHGATPCR